MIWKNGSSAFALAMLLAMGCGQQAPPLKSASPDAPLVVPPAGALAYAPRLGQERVYRVASTGTLALDYAQLAHAVDPNAAGVDVPGQGPTAARMHESAYGVTAELHTRVLSRSDDVVQVVMRLQKFSYEVNKIKETRTRLFESPFLVKISKRGEIREFSFPVGFPPEIAGTIKGMVEPMQVVFGDDASKREGEWTSTQHSAKGDSAIRYRSTWVAPNGTVVRLQRRTIGANFRGAELTGRQETSVVRFSTKVEKSGGTVDWAADGSGPVKIAYTDDTATAMGISPFSKHIANYTAELTTVAPAELPTTLEAANAYLESPEAARLATYHVPPQARAKLKDLKTTAAVLDDFMAKVDAQGSEATFTLQYHLREKPDALREVVTRFDKLPETKENLIRVGKAYSAIAAAGHVEAQQMLAEIIGSGSYSRMSRDRALRATLSLEMPESFLVPVVWQYREALPRTGAGSNVALSVATNVYGALGGTEHRVKENTAEVVRVLGERLQSTQEDFEKYLVLVALGNVGDFDLVYPLTQSYLTSPRASLRGAAFHTFQKAQGDVAFQAFATHYAAETDGNVRRDASSVVEAMPHSALRNPWAASQVVIEKDEVIQARYVQILGDGLKSHPENEPTLRQLLDTVDNRNVRLTLYRYVGPNATGGAQ